MGILVIEKQDLKHNIKQIKEYAKKDNEKLKIIAIVKSNGYGLGLEEYANFLIDNGIDYLAVASTDEAIKLREAGIKEDILMMSSTAIEQELEDMVTNNITITIGSTEAKDALIKIIKRINKNPKVHIKIDTGFGRYGYLYTDTEKIIKDIKELQKFVTIEGIFFSFFYIFLQRKLDELTI
ncbi:MAG: alanine racemase [Clostridia bacterium]